MLIAYYHTMAINCAKYACSNTILQLFRQTIYVFCFLWCDPTTQIPRTFNKKQPRLNCAWYASIETSQAGYIMNQWINKYPSVIFPLVIPGLLRSGRGVFDSPFVVMGGYFILSTNIRFAHNLSEKKNNKFWAALTRMETGDTELLAHGSFQNCHTNPSLGDTCLLST